MMLKRSRIVYAGLRMVLAAALITQLLSVTASAAQPQHAIMVLGDSISAGYGIPPEQGWVDLLQQHYQHSATQREVQVINASISGETTGGALNRLPALLEQHQPSIVIIELGGNDGLRGYPIDTFRQHLTELVKLSQSASAKVLLAGMHIPPNYGPRYAGQFHDSYALIANTYQTALLPFLLEGVATQAELMQADGIHPTSSAQPRILQNVLPYLNLLLDAAG